MILLLKLELEMSRCCATYIQPESRIQCCRAVNVGLITIGDVHQCIAVTECIMMPLPLLTLYPRWMKAGGMKSLSSIKGKIIDKYITDRCG